MEKIKKKLNSKSVAGYVFTAPLIFGFLFFLLVPMIISMYYSFCDYNILSPAKFSGLANYKKMITDDTFWLSLKVTFYFAFVSVPLKLIFALFVAMLLLKNSKLSGFYRAAYYLPSVIGGSVAVAVLWKRMFAMDGVINRLLQAVGIPCEKSWLGDTKTAIWVLIFLVVWQFGSSMLIFLSALKQIPASLYEAADIDGASGVRAFFKITLPLLSPTVFFVLVTRVIGALQVFDLVYMVMDISNPALKKTESIVYLFYQYSFQNGNKGYGSTIVVLLLAVIMVLTVFQMIGQKKWVHYN